MPRAIAAVVSAKLASLRDLDEHYGIRDLYDMLEVLFVDAYNQRVVTDGQNNH